MKILNIFSILVVTLLLFSFASATVQQKIQIKTAPINSDITLNAGWNGFSMLIGNQETTGDRTVNLTSGRNLIGYSSAKSIKVKEIIFANASGTYTYQQAISNGLLLSLNITSGNTSLGQSVVNTKDYLYMNKAYWFVVSSNCNVTFKDVAGSRKNDSYRLIDLMFRNASGVEKNITDAVGAGWVGAEDYDVNKAVYYSTTDENTHGQVWGHIKDYQLEGFDTCQDMKDFYEAFVGQPVDCDFSTWKGYFIYGFKDNITLLRQNNITNAYNDKKIHIAIKGNSNKQHLAIKK